METWITTHHVSHSVHLFAKTAPRHSRINQSHHLRTYDTCIISYSYVGSRGRAADQRSTQPNMQSFAVDMSSTLPLHSSIKPITKTMSPSNTVSGLSVGGQSQLMPLQPLRPSRPRSYDLRPCHEGPERRRYRYRAIPPLSRLDHRQQSPGRRAGRAVDRV